MASSASAAETTEALAAKLLVMGFDGAGEQPPEHARRLIRAGGSPTQHPGGQGFGRLVAPGQRHRLEGRTPRRRVQCSFRTHTSAGRSKRLTEGCTEVSGETLQQLMMMLLVDGQASPLKHSAGRLRVR
jgi:hypothetical protein